MTIEHESVADPPTSDGQLIAMLVDRARSEGLQLTGEGGLLQQWTKRMLESALEGEITDHLGYEKHDAAGRNTGNSRNGTRSKTVLTDVGPVEVRVPRDVEGSFEPQIVRKRQSEPAQSRALLPYQATFAMLLLGWTLPYSALWGELRVAPDRGDPVI